MVEPESWDVLWVEREGLWSQAGLFAGEAAVIVMVDNHPAPSGLKTLLIEAGLFPVAEMTFLFSGLYCEVRVPQEMLPASPWGWFTEILSAICLLFSSIPGTSHLQFVTGLAGKREWERNVSFPFPKPCLAPKEQPQS